MSITHDGTTFAGDHYKIQADMPEIEMQVAKFAAVNGESHIVGKPGGRNLWTSYTVRGFATATLLESHITAINILAGTLTGTVTNVITGESYGRCTFRGYEVAERFYDPGGNAWVAQGRLVWRQRIPAS